MRAYPYRLSMTALAVASWSSRRGGEGEEAWPSSAPPSPSRSPVVRACACVRVRECGRGGGGWQGDLARVRREGVVLEDRLHLLYLVTPVANLRPVFYNVLKCFETLKSVANLRPVPPTPGPSASRHMRFF